MHKTIKVIARLLLVFCFCSGILIIYTQRVIASTPSQQEPEENPLSVEVDRNSLSTNEILTLSVRVRLGSLAINAPQPQLPTLDDFNILDSSTSSQVSFFNGAISSETIYQYRLQPLHSGELTIGAVSLTIDGITYSSDPISIQVSADTLAPDNAPSAEAPLGMEAQDLFVEAALDNPSPYLGEAVLYTFRFYQALNLYSQPYYAPPNFTGFWSEADANQHQYNREIEGKTYRVTELDTLLFATRSGELVIEPARLKIEGGLFDPNANLQTEAIQVQVKPLPENTPEGFNGAVGQFEIQAVLAEQQSEVNQPVMLTITLSGAGNIQNLPDPVWPAMAGWRSYESRAVIQKELRDGQLYGSRIYERLLVPSAAGEYELPPVSYVYFDPQDETYHSIHTGPLTVTILPGEYDVASADNAGTGENTTAQNNDISHIHPIDELQKKPAALPYLPFYWAAWLIPLLGVGGSLMYEHRQRNQQQRAGVIRRSGAVRKALAELKTARLESSSPYERSVQILNAYLSDKLGRPAHALTRPILNNLLETEGVSPILRQRLDEFLQTCDAARFASTANTLEPDLSFYDETGSLIETLEQAFISAETHTPPRMAAQ